MILGVKSITFWQPVAACLYGSADGDGMKSGGGISPTQARSGLEWATRPRIKTIEAIIPSLFHPFNFTTVSTSALDYRS